MTPVQYLYVLSMTKYAMTNILGVYDDREQAIRHYDRRVREYHESKEEGLTLTLKRYVANDIDNQETYVHRRNF